MAYKSTDDRKAASKRHYEAHKADYMLRNKRYRTEIQEYVRQIKESTPCADCKQQFAYYVMDFDHIGDKLNNISFLSATGRIGAVKKEIENCEIVCANCHRIRTHKRL
ncbi:hypothetical protein H7Y63_01415 [Polaromonas sp.]|nr:hypothetical protein [Candidatus Saccharibacteria bacterium]